MKTLTVSRLFRMQPIHRPLRWSTQFVPFLRVSGKWLAAAGFHPGGKVTIRVENGALIIEPLREGTAR
jgi:hypothetical protein